MMQRMQLITALAAAITLLQGCSATSFSGSRNISDGQDEIISSAGEIDQKQGEVRLIPVPLYGMPELSVGAHWRGQNALDLVLCDRQQRVLQQDKPLVLYLDGDFVHLEIDGESPVKAGCSYFAIDGAQLRHLISSKQAMLRVFYKQQMVEQRISGTASDYFSRPKSQGPQQRLQKFVDLLPLPAAEKQLVDG